MEQVVVSFMVVGMAVGALIEFLFKPLMVRFKPSKLLASGKAPPDPFWWQWGLRLLSVLLGMAGGFWLHPTATGALVGIAAGGFWTMAVMVFKTRSTVPPPVDPTDSTEG